MSDHASCRSSTAAHSSSTARQGLTGYERAGACREFSAQARDGGANARCDVGARQNSADIGPSCPERREKQHSIFGGRYIRAHLMR